MANETDTISSRDNAKLKHARSVRDGKAGGEIFVEGVRLVAEALRSDTKITAALVTVDFASSPESAGILEQLQIKRVPVLKVAARAFDSIADTESPQGIVVLAERPNYGLATLQPPTSLVVFLEKINNPSNLGAVIRTAEAAGVAAVITSRDSADAFSPKSIRASMGSCFRLPVIERVSFSEAVGWAREAGFETTAADIGGTKSYIEIDWKIPRLLIFGSEAHGLSERELAQVDQKVVIPMANSVESLNLAVSAGVLLFEAKRQRG